MTGQEGGLAPASAQITRKRGQAHLPDLSSFARHHVSGISLSYTGIGRSYTGTSLFSQSQASRDVGEFVMMNRASGRTPLVLDLKRHNRSAVDLQSKL